MIQTVISFLYKWILLSNLKLNFKYLTYNAIKLNLKKKKVMQCFPRA